MAARGETEVSKPRARTPIRRTLGQIAEGEPAPGSPIVAPVNLPAPQVEAFSYQAPRFNPGKKGNQAYQVPNAPQFYAPPFVYPRGEDVFEDPSYQFRLNEGMKALERSAAAKGTLRTGNTLQDLMRYGQDYASQEYDKATQRALAQHGANYATTRDMYLPQYATWEARNRANETAWEQAQRRLWDEYTFRLDDQFRREQMLYGGGLGTY